MPMKLSVANKVKKQHKNMNISQIKKIKRERRHNRVRAKVFGTDERPRMSVFRSNKYLYVQIINDDLGKTLVSASSKEIKAKVPKEAALELGKAISTKAQKAGIKKVVFDRGGYLFTGKIKSIADGARDGGLIF